MSLPPFEPFLRFFPAVAQYLLQPLTQTQHTTQEINPLQTQEINPLQTQEINPLQTKRGRPCWEK